MKKYIALLRGINVSGQKKIKMSDLVNLLKETGLSHVQTYIQSGNIIFESKSASHEKLASVISKSIKEKYEFDVPVIVVTPFDLKNIISNNPWDNEKEKELDKIYVTILSATPSRESLEKLSSIKYENEEYIVKNKIIYFYAGAGYGRAKMNNNFFENKFKVFATTRNWKTINKLIDLCGN